MSRKDDWLEDKDEDIALGITREKKLTMAKELEVNRRMGGIGFKGMPIELSRTIQTGYGTTIFLVGYGADLHRKIFVAHLHHDAHEQSHGKIPPELELRCPWCDELLKAGEKKTVTYYMLPEARRVPHPETGETIVQTHVVSVEEDMRCPHPSKSGKGICGFRFVIRENVLSKA